MARKSAMTDLAALRARLAEAAAAKAEALAAAEAERARAHEEEQLFRRAVADVTPLKAPERHAAPPQPPAPIPRQRKLDDARVLVESISDDFDAETLLETDDLLSWHRLGIGPDVVRRLRRGAWVIQDELDLHGARRDEAREQLALFLRESVRRGLRCVRVIHGKGLGSIERQPVLKARVRRWLTQKDEVLAFCQARGQDGGGGALIVLLRPA